MLEKKRHALEARIAAMRADYEDEMTTLEAELAREDTSAQLADQTFSALAIQRSRVNLDAA
jgi:vacuolar-type H+-ATPase subunit D/Vma8